MISIVIPAHNRPAYLLEAVKSITEQNYHNFEVVVIGDGSTPAIEKAPLQAILGEHLKLIRHNKALGIPKTKNAGIKAASGEVILLLDDDDLLSPEALRTIGTSFTEHPELDCIFMGVEPFGPYATNPKKNRETAINKIFSRLNPEESNGLYHFSPELFYELLHSVPIDFQRPAARRGAWNIVGGFDENAQYSESTWAIRAATMCTVALTKKPLNLWRIHDSNFGWPEGKSPHQIKTRQMDIAITTANQLLTDTLKQRQNINTRIKALKHQRAELLFAKAYYLRDKDWLEGLKTLSAAFFIKPQPVHLKLAVKYLIAPQMTTKTDRKNTLPWSGEQ